MKLQHTPGPWNIIGGFDANGKGNYFPSVVLTGPLEFENGKRIAINVSHDQKIESIMANAKLIAAAPDLLNAALLAYPTLTKDTEANAAILKILINAIEKATK